MQMKTLIPRSTGLDPILRDHRLRLPALRKYLFIALLALSLALGELHSFWNKDTGVYNWILRDYVPMTIAWNIRTLASGLQPMIWFAAFWFYKPNRANRSALAAFILATSLDFLMLMYNYKRWGYGHLYLWVAGFWLLVFFWSQIKSVFCLLKNLFR